jgi:hypothetical protein
VSVIRLIDALIFVAWSSLVVAFLQKAIMVTTAFRPIFFGMSPIDFCFVSALALLFALALAARAWVRANEPEMLARRRRARLSNAGYELDEMPDFANARAQDEPARRTIAGA